MSEQKEDQQKINTSNEQKATQNIDDLDNALNEDDDPLNVTADERSQAGDDDQDQQLKQELEKFMQDMQGDNGQGTQFLNQMMKQMFQGMNLNAPTEGQNQEYEDPAGIILKEFLNKDILEEPLIDSQKKYKEYLEENKEKLSQDDKTRYLNQQKCIDEILEIVQKEPNNQEKIILKFEEMQEYGQPPESLVNVFGGESPFAAFTQPQNLDNVPFNMFGGGAPNLMKGGGAPGEECRIF